MLTIHYKAQNCSTFFRKTNKQLRTYFNRIITLVFFEHQPNSQVRLSRFSQKINIQYNVEPIDFYGLKKKNH